MVDHQDQTDVIDLTTDHDEFVQTPTGNHLCLWHYLYKYSYTPFSTTSEEPMSSLDKSEEEIGTVKRFK